jgi:hypothetical protein
MERAITYLQGSQASRTRFRRSAGGISAHLPRMPILLGNVTNGLAIVYWAKDNFERRGCGGSMDGGHSTRRKGEPEQKAERAGFVGQYFSCMFLL